MKDIKTVCAGSACDPYMASMMSDAVSTAMATPEVDAARRAFLDRVKVVTDGQLFATNYYDKVLFGAIETVLKRGKMDADAVGRLVDLYCAFVDALAPFQPDPETVREAASAPRQPWEADLAEIEGRVFYVLPNSDGYWVEGSTLVRDKVDPILAVLSGKI